MTKTTANPSNQPEPAIFFIIYPHDYDVAVVDDESMMRCHYYSLILFVGYAAPCQLPINFTYFQRAAGFYCQAPNQYLKTQYGVSFSVDTNGTARETNNPYVFFTIKEVTSWDELVARLAELDPGVSRGGAHTPSLFWDGRQDFYWHANAEEDTISNGDFKQTVDTYIADCLSPVTSTPASPPMLPTSTQQPSQSEPSGGDECAIDHDGLPSDQQHMENVTHHGEDSIQCFAFFFSRGCPHCAVIRDYIEGDLRNANVTFRYEAYEVRTSDYSRRLIAGYQHFGWNKTQGGVPTIFIGDEDDMSVLVGEGAILDQLLPRILELQDDPTTCYDFAQLLEDPNYDVGNVHWGVLTAAALVDSINPCAIAVLLILLGGLVMSVVNEEVHAEPSSTPQPGIHPAPMDDQPTSAEENKERMTSERETKNEQEIETSDLDIERAAGSGAADTIGPSTSPDAGAVATSADATNGTTASSSDKERMSNERETRKSEQQTETTDLDIEMAVCSGAGDNISPSTSPDAGAAIVSADATNGTTASNIESGNRSHRRRAFLSGMAFILAVFLAYYALGFGIFTAVGLTRASSVILLVLGIFVIILGAWNIKDFLCYDKGYNVEIPRSWRPLLKRVLGAVTSPVGAFAAGFIVCLFELPCTGGPYLFILALLADQNTRTEAAFSLLYYNFIFVLPLIIINCLVFWSLPMLKRVVMWKERRIRLLHMFAGLVLITLGLLAVVNSQHPLF